MEWTQTTNAFNVETNDGKFFSIQSMKKCLICFRVLYFSQKKYYIFWANVRLANARFAWLPVNDSAMEEQTEAQNMKQ